MRQDKYAVYGECGGSFTNLKEAKQAARFASTLEENGYAAEVWLIDDGCSYIEYENGKMIRDGWTIRK